MKQIIIVDDRLENRYMLESLLKGDEYIISTAKNGAEALSLARKSPPNLIITDILMPVMDGFTLCTEWRKDATLKKIPFIFYTAAYTNPRDVKFALKLGADRFLIKPLEPADFLTVVREVLYEFELGKVEAKTETAKNEAEDLREYNAVLFRKLEEKLYQAELNDRKLKKYAMALEKNIQNLELSEENLRQTHDYLENLFNRTTAPIIVWNPTFYIIRFNHAFEHLTGYKAREVVGQKLEILFPESTRYDSLAEIKKTINGTHWESVEIPILTKNKEIRIILWNSSSIYDVKGKILISTIAQGQDITERKKAEEALRNSEAKLKELNLTKDKFFSIIAHDLKGPFNGILGFSNILGKEANELDPTTIAEYAGLINKAANHVYSLLDNLLTWARVQQGQIPYNPISTDLKEVVNEVLTLLSEYSDHKMITLVNNLPDGLTVSADIDMLKVVLRNLVSNAIKFTDTKGKVELNAVKQNASVEISVKDNGKGMSHDHLEKLFRIDSNFSTPGTSDESGTGLGLILTKEFVDKHCGEIWAESTEGTGTVLHFTLPSTDKNYQKDFYKIPLHSEKHNVKERA